MALQPLSLRQHIFGLLSAVPIAATLASHVVFYRHFPWQASYRFLLPYFLTVATVMPACWMANLTVFTWLDRRLPFHQHPVRRLAWQILWGGLATLTTFLVVFPNAIRLYTGNWPTSNLLASGIVVCLTIATIINGGYVGWYLMQALQWEKETAGQLTEQLRKRPKPVIAPTDGVWIETGTRRIKLDWREIAYFFSTQGLVLVVKTDGQQLTTAYGSFARLMDQLPDERFFQLSRQFLVSVEAIRTVEDDRNRKLSVQIVPGLHKQQPAEWITVSRYRSAEFKKWLQQGAAA